MPDTEDDDLLSPRALLRTMAIAALIASAVSACSKSIENPVAPQPPRPHAEAAGGAQVLHAIYQSDRRQRAFFAEGEKADKVDEAPRLVIRT
jgi:hypothetical protein